MSGFETGWDRRINHHWGVDLAGGKNCRGKSIRYNVHVLRLSLLALLLACVGSCGSQATHDSDVDRERRKQLDALAALEHKFIAQELQLENQTCFINILRERLEEMEADRSTKANEISDLILELDRLRKRIRELEEDRKKAPKKK